MNLEKLVEEYHIYDNKGDIYIGLGKLNVNEREFLKNEINRLGKENIIKLIHQIKAERYAKQEQQKKEKMLNELKEKTQCNYNSMYCFGLDELYSRGIQREVFEQLSKENLVEIKDDGDYIISYNVNINGIELLKRMEKIQNEINRKNKEKNLQNERELEKLKIQAKTTGKRVFYKKEIGYDKCEDCEVDINYYIMPNGEITIERILAY